MNKKAFTLIELLAVIVIIAIIAVIGVFSITKIMKKVREDAIADTALAVRKAASLNVAQTPMEDNMKILDMTPGTGEEAHLLDATTDPNGDPYIMVKAHVVKDPNGQTKVDVFMQTKTTCYLLEDGAATTRIVNTCASFMIVTESTDPSWHMYPITLRPTTSGLIDIKHVNPNSLPKVSAVIPFNNDTFLGLGYGKWFKFDYQGYIKSEGILENQSWVNGYRVAAKDNVLAMINWRWNSELGVGERSLKIINMDTMTDIISEEYSPESGGTMIPTFDELGNVIVSQKYSDVDQQRIKIYKYLKSNTYNPAQKTEIADFINPFSDNTNDAISTISNNKLYLIGSYEEAVAKRVIIVDLATGTSSTKITSGTLNDIQNYELTSMSLGPDNNIYTFTTDWTSKYAIDKYDTSMNFIENVYNADSIYLWGGFAY